MNKTTIVYAVVSTLILCGLVLVAKGAIPIHRPADGAAIPTTPVATPDITPAPAPVLGTWAWEHTIMRDG